MAMWCVEKTVEDFIKVAGFANVQLSTDSIIVEELNAPHAPPQKLPLGYLAVYVFSLGPTVLKVGKVGAKSKARYVSQHYNPRSAMSTLAGSILSDRTKLVSELDEISVGPWIRANIDRVNLLMDERLGMRLATLLEAFLQCRLRPIYEGFKSQKT